MQPGNAGGGAALARTLLKRMLPSCEQKVLLVDFAVYSPPERRGPLSGYSTRSTLCRQSPWLPNGTNYAARSWKSMTAERTVGRCSELVTSLDQAVWAYRCGFFTLDTVNYLIREHDGETNGLGSRTPVSRGALPAHSKKQLHI